MGRMESVADLGRGGDEIFYPGPAEASSEKLIRVVDVTEDLLKSGKVFAEFRIEVRLGIKKTGQRAVLDRAGRVGVKSAVGQRGNVAVAQDLQMAVGKTLPQQSDGRKSKKKIPDRAATDDEDLGSFDLGVSSFDWRGNLPHSTIENREWKISESAAAAALSLGQLRAQDTGAFPAGRFIPRNGPARLACLAGLFILCSAGREEDGQRTKGR